MSAVVVERLVPCAADVSRLWPVITDTERLNRAIGLGRIELTPVHDDTAARYVVNTVSGGFPLEYEERPYEWVEPTRFSVRRIVRKGLVRFLDNSFELRPRDDGGSDVVIRITVDPKFGVLSPILKLQISRFLARIAGEIQQIDRAILGQNGKLASRTNARVDFEELERLAKSYLELLEKEEQPIGVRILDLVREAPDLEVDRIRPFELADRWGENRDLVLGVCLRGVQAGVLELTWDLVCPSCRTASERMRTLAELGAHAHCQLCDISYDMDLDQAVEATFRPAAGLRDVDEGPYCIGGPARTPHVLAQAILPADGSIELNAPPRPGRYRLFVRGGPAAILKVNADGAASLDVKASEGNLEPAQAELRPGALICVANSGSERHVKIEHVDWPRAAATAHHVSMLPAFRRQFAREVLRPGLTLRIARVSLLFTDLTGSTALYTQMGDARAFGVVQAHFDLLSKIIGERHGTIVKTIGDAVMAAFLHEQDAVRAAAAMHEAFPAFRAEFSDAEGVRLKIGVYSGPCYAVTANGMLDYFGQSVNVAARLQGAAEGGELVLPEALAEEARSAGWLGPDPPVQYFEATLKGLAGPLKAERVLLDPS